MMGNKATDIAMQQQDTLFNNKEDMGRTSSKRKMTVGPELYAQWEIGIKQHYEASFDIFWAKIGPS